MSVRGGCASAPSANLAPIPNFEMACNIAQYGRTLGKTFIIGGDEMACRHLRQKVGVENSKEL